MIRRRGLAVLAGGLSLLTVACGSATSDGGGSANPGTPPGAGVGGEVGTGALIGTRPASTGPTYYLSPGGNDANPGTSPDRPWQTLNKAARELRAGDTLLLRGGTYRTGNFFQPANSGTSDNPITIKAYPNEVPVITGAPTYNAYFMIIGKSWITIDGLHFVDTTGGTLIWTDSASRLLIRNCSFSSHGGDDMINIARGGYNRIENNTFDTTGDPSGPGAGDHIYIRGSDYNIIQGNYFKKAGHYAIDTIHYDAETSDHNIIRDNTIEQHWGGGIGLIMGSTHTLVERNRIAYSGEEVTSYPKVGIQVAAATNVVRNNLIVKTSASPFRDHGMAVYAYTFAGVRQHARDNRIYNNVIYKSGRSAVAMNQKDGSVNTRNKFLNNVFYFNSVGGPAQEWAPPGNYYLYVETYHAYADNKWPSFPNGNAFFNNLMLHATSAGDFPNEDPVIFYDHENWGHSLAWVQSTYPAAFKGNVSRNPMFVDAERDNFRLRVGSPAIDAGAHLARTSAAGTRTTAVPVDDAYFFTDGFGLVQGDVIRIGANAPVRVTGVDYGTRTLTVSGPVSFRSGDFVDMPYAGSAPDMGAFEHQ